MNSLLHSARAAAWEAARNLIAKPLPGGTSPDGPLVVAGSFTTASGMGELARACADALEQNGLRPICVDISSYFGQGDCDAGRPLSSIPADRTGTLILYANALETPRALLKLGMTLGKRWRLIGGWAWELPRIPPSWTSASQHVSEIWALSSFSADAIRSGVTIPVRIVRPRVRPSINAVSDKEKFGVRVDHVLCLAMADARSSFARKNAAGAIRVFRAAAGARTDIGLIVKTRNADENAEDMRILRSAAEGDSRVQFLDATLSNAERWSLLASCDVFLSLHRSEGLGLAVAEAMSVGKTALVTQWSGVTDFVSADTALLVPYALRPVNSGFAVYDSLRETWAEPDESAAARILKRAFDEPDLRKQIGIKARQATAQIFTGDDVISALRGE